MSEYKVPQDVEAEDKLLGPFSFRQFIYLIVAAIAGFLCWALAQVFIGLLLIPLPIVVFFLILALPLRKDQPMEAYLLAMVQFFLKPHNRYWSPDGDINVVEITVPHVVEKHLTKDFSGDEASERLAYLANVIDTGGWATRGVNPAMTDDAAMAVAHTEDVLDEDSGVVQSFDDLLSTSSTQRKQAMIDRLRQSIDQSSGKATTAPSQLAEPTTPTSQPSVDSEQPTGPAPKFDPYPNSMRQKVISPTSQTEQAASKPDDESKHKPSPQTVSPDIMRLANNNDLSISAIAHQAHLKDDASDQEVVISLR
ncbi:MAG TPA: PrgI family protein [Candidatus Saccharimonadales bacterium]|nr:PrgI family protein [Candidatus Saccharimonadales bacterium]